MIAALLLVACASQAARETPRVGIDDLREAVRLAGLDDAEAARVFVDRAIVAMLSENAEATDDESDRSLREAGALAYKLRSMESARRAWDAVRKYREKTLDPDSREVQNARGNVSWIGEQMGLVDEARVFEEQILDALEKNAAPNDEALLFARSNLADTLLQQDVEHERALDLMRNVSEARRAQFPAGHKKRLRAELDLACGLVGVGKYEEADVVAARVLAECPAKEMEVRVRAAADLVWIRVARGERDPFRAAVATLADEVDHAHAEIAVLDWRAAEIRAAELAPFEDLLASAVQGLGVFPADEELARRVALHGARAGEGPAQVVFHRFERSRIERAGESGLRVVADERLAVWLKPTSVDSKSLHWLDLGPMKAARSLVQSWSDAAQKGPARDEARAVTDALFVPVLRALGDLPASGTPRVLRIVPDDVIWVIPLGALELGLDTDRAIGVEVVLPGAAIGGEERGVSWAVFGDPSASSAIARVDAPPRGGVPAEFLRLQLPPSSLVTDAWSERVGVEAVRGEAAGVARFRALAGERTGIVWTESPGIAPPSTPCLTEPRAILPMTTIASAMAREDVVGGSSPADLCWMRFADFGGPASDDGRCRSARRAGDLRDMQLDSPARLVLTNSWQTSDDLRLQARCIEALARALAAAGFGDVCFATQSIRDVESATMPADLERSVPRATPQPDEPAPGPWLRVRTSR